MGRRVAPPENLMSVAAASASAGTVARRLAHGTLPRQLPGSAARPARGIRRGGPGRATPGAGRSRAGARPPGRLRDAARGGDLPDRVLVELHRAPELGRDRPARRRRPRLVPPRHPPAARRPGRLDVARHRRARRVPRRARAGVPHRPGDVDRLRADRRPRPAVRVGDLAHDPWTRASLPAPQLLPRRHVQDGGHRLPGRRERGPRQRRAAARRLGVVDLPAAHGVQRRDAVARHLRAPVARRPVARAAGARGVRRRPAEHALRLRPRRRHQGADHRDGARLLRGDRLVDPPAGGRGPRAPAARDRRRGAHGHVLDHDRALAGGAADPRGAGDGARAQDRHAGSRGRLARAAVVDRRRRPRDRPRGADDLLGDPAREGRGRGPGPGRDGPHRPRQPRRARAGPRRARRVDQRRLPRAVPGRHERDAARRRRGGHPRARRTGLGGVQARPRAPVRRHRLGRRPPVLHAAHGPLDPAQGDLRRRSGGARARVRRGRRDPRRGALRPAPEGGVVAGRRSAHRRRAGGQRHGLPRHLPRADRPDARPRARRRQVRRAGPDALPGPRGVRRVLPAQGRRQRVREPGLRGLRLRRLPPRRAREGAAAVVRVRPRHHGRPGHRALPARRPAPRAVLEPPAGRTTSSSTARRSPRCGSGGRS